jgi:hypothetical protein
MLVLRHRLAIAGIIAAAAIAVPVAALASASGSPPGKPGAPPTAVPAAPAASKSPPPGNPAPPQGAAASKEAEASKEAVAAQQGVPAPVQAFAARLGVGITAAGPAFKEVAGLAGPDGRVDTGSQAFAAIASELGVSPARLAAAWAAVSQDMPGK